jgi:hypothetical protein
MKYLAAYLQLIMEEIFSRYDKKLLNEYKDLIHEQGKPDEMQVMFKSEYIVDIYPNRKVDKTGVHVVSITEAARLYPQVAHVPFSVQNKLQEFDFKLRDYVQQKKEVESWVWSQLEDMPYVDDRAQYFKNQMPDFLYNYLASGCPWFVIRERTKELKFQNWVTENNYKKFVKPALEFYIGFNLLGL